MVLTFGLGAGLWTYDWLGWWEITSLLLICLCMAVGAWATVDLVWMDCALCQLRSRCGIIIRARFEREEP